MSIPSPDTMMKARAGHVLMVKGERLYRKEVIMGRALGAGPSVGHPFHCETSTLRTIHVANSSELTRTWSSCAAHSTKATRTVREALLQQSMAGNTCYRAGERITEPDCQGDEGRAGNNRQSKKKKGKMHPTLLIMRVV